MNELQSKYVTIDGVNVHYIEAGSGDPPVLLLHGIPTHSALWRQVIPHIAPHARTIAIDLIGFGKSDKPTNIEYDLPTYTRFLEQVINALNLKNMIIAAMDLGLIIGLNYAMQHEENISGIVMFEGVFLPLERGLNNQAFSARLLMKLFGIKRFAESMIVRNGVNMVGQMMTAGTIRKFTKDELAAYQEPLRDEAVRRKVWFEGIGPYTILSNIKQPGELANLVREYSAKLCASPIPKLLLFAEPGAAVTQKSVIYARQNITNLEVKHIGKGKHFLPEDQPDNLGQAVVEFLCRIR